GFRFCRSIFISALNLDDQRHGDNCAMAPELPPELVAARLRKGVDEADIGAVADCVQRLERWQRLGGGDMAVDRAVGAASDQVAGHLQPGFHISDRRAAGAYAKCEGGLASGA